MTENNNYSISTPNIRKYKSLGIRHIGTNRKNVSKTPVSETKVKVILATKSESPKTPLTASNLETQQNRASKSTGCLPLYKLSMNKKFRAQYKKKKLEFSTVDAPGSKETDLKIKPIPTTSTNFDPESFKENENKEHENKIIELKNTIEIWKTAFKNSLDDLSNKLNEDKEIILQKLLIPSDMMKLA